MKSKIVIAFFLSLFSAVVSAQTFTPQSLGGSATTKSTVVGALQGLKGMVITGYADTTAANLDARVKNENGMMIRVDSFLFIRYTPLSKWIKAIGSSGGGGSGYSLDSITSPAPYSLYVAWVGGSQVFSFPTFLKKAYGELPIVVDSTGVDSIRIRCINCGTVQNGRVSGLVVSHDTLYQYDVTAGVAVINQAQYTSVQSIVTLQAANISFDRIDVIADSLGTIVVKTGVAAASPQEPQIDPATEIPLTFITVYANTTTPPNVTLTTIYDERFPAEWTPTNPGFTVNFADLSSPYHLLKAASTASYTSTKAIAFTTTNSINKNDIDLLKFYIFLKANLASTSNIQVRFYNGTTAVTNLITLSAVYGFSKTVSGYQNVTIPTDPIIFSNPVFNKIIFTFTGAGAGVFLDWVQLQGGMPQPSTGGITGLYRIQGRDSIYWKDANGNQQAIKDSLLNGYVSINQLNDTTLVFLKQDGTQDTVSISNNAGSGSVTSVTASLPLSITGTPTVNPNVVADTTSGKAIALTTQYQLTKTKDSLQTNINLKVNTADSVSGVATNYVTQYQRKKTSDSLLALINTKLNITDTGFLHGRAVLSFAINGTADSAILTLYGGARYAVKVGSSGGGGDVTGPSSSTDNAVTRFDGTTGKIIQNSGVSLTDSGAFIFPPRTAQTYAKGQLYYDSTSESLAFHNNDLNPTLNIGQEEWIRVKNVSGSTILNGSAIYINGASGGLPTIALARSNAAATTVGMGLTTEDIANNAIGYVTSMGVVHGLNTAAFTSGLAVYIDATTPGALTQTAPTDPNYRYRVGIVVTSDATNGSIHVTPSTAALGNSTANRILTMNQTGTNQEWKTLLGTTNQVTVTAAANTFTIAIPSTLAKVDSIWRTLGQDSIKFSIGGRLRSIKDSTGGGVTGWSLTGNAATAGSNFLGTTNSVSLRLRANNVEAMMIDSSNQHISLGGGAADASFQVKVGTNGGFGLGMVGSSIFRFNMSAAGGNGYIHVGNDANGILNIVGSSMALATTQLTGTAQWTNSRGLNIGSAAGAASAGATYQLNGLSVISQSLDSTRSFFNNNATFKQLYLVGSNGTVITDDNVNTNLYRQNNSALMDVYTINNKGTLPVPRVTSTIKGNINLKGISKGTLASGTGYSSGTYPPVALTGGSGTGATANLRVSAGVVDLINIQNAGINYVIGDVLSSSSIGGGTGFTFTVTGLTGEKGLMAYDTTQNALNIYNGTSWLPISIISGSASQVGTATTTFTVTIGSTQSSNSYKVQVTPTNILSAAAFYVNNKTTTTFDVVYLAGLTGTVAFDWSLFP